MRRLIPAESALGQRNRRRPKRWVVTQLPASDWSRSSFVKLKFQGGKATVEFAIASLLVLSIAFGFGAISLLGGTKLWLSRVGRETAICLGRMDLSTFELVPQQTCFWSAKKAFHLWLPENTVHFAARTARSTPGRSELHVQATFQIKGPFKEPVQLRAKFPIANPGRPL